MSDEKEVEYYAAKANAWFNTKLEYDKSILVLSAGAIGLLITLLTTIGVKSITLLIIFIMALISFIVCLVSILAIFSRNAKHLEELIQGKKTNDSLLSFLDATAIFSFILGIILASIIGISIATNNVFLKESKMTDKKVTTNETIDLIESFNGANKISPKNSDTLTKSFNGAQNIAPQAQENDTSSSTDNTSTTQPESQTQTTNTDVSDEKKP